MTTLTRLIIPAFSAALENNQVGQTSSWTDPDTGERYYVTPTETYSQGGSPCRRFVIEREIAGKEYQSTETACARRTAPGGSSRDRRTAIL